GAAMCIRARSIWDCAHSLRRSRTKQGVILGVKKRATGKDEPAAVIGSPELDSTDKALLCEYENVMVSALGQIFRPDASRDAVLRSIQSGIRQGQFSRSQLVRLRGRSVNDGIFLVVACCAYANYRISSQLRSVVAVCGAAAPKEVLWVSHHMNEFAGIEDGMDESFGIPVRYLTEWVIEWIRDGFEYRTAVDMDMVNRLFRSQLRKYPSTYLEIQKKTDYFTAYVMARVIRTEEPEMYRREILSKSTEQRDKVIDILTAGGNCIPESRSYLEGRLGLSALRALSIRTGGSYSGDHSARKALEWYDETYHDEIFYARCMAYMALRGCYKFFLYVNYLHQEDANDILPEKMVQHTFQGLHQAGMELAEQLYIACLLVAEGYEDERRQPLISCCVTVFQQYQAERPQEMKDAFAGGGPFGRYLALLIYSREERWEGLLACSLDDSKLIRQKLEQILADHPQWRPQVMELLSSKKAAQREMGIKVLSRWDTPQDRAALRQLQEKEKSPSIRSLLEEVLCGVEEREDAEERGAGSSQTMTRGELVKELHRGGRRRSLAWAFETPFSLVHREGGGWAREEYLQALLLCYSSMKEPGPNANAVLLAKKLDSRDLAVFMNELLDKWMADGGETRKRWVLYAASIHGDGDIVRKLQHQIPIWSRHSRSAMAAEAVQALALSPQALALPVVDSIARKFSSKKVRAAAVQALEETAVRLGLTREQLEDKMVPDFGFDEHMERRFDYGNRSFVVTVTTALEVEIYDENGRRLKNMPAPGARDQAEKATEAYADFKEMKKQMKTAIASYKQRLERVLSSERLWTAAAWRELFVGNPVMHRFATGLVWGIYRENKLEQSFRYMEDGSFNTEDEEEYVLPEQGLISLIHPLELSDNSLETWRRQLKDYEITQPIEQLGRTVYRLTTGEQESNSLERFCGMTINDLSLGSRLTAQGWQCGPVYGKGRFNVYYQEEPLLGLGAELHFSGSIVGSGSMGGQAVTVQDVRFYQLGTVKRGADCYDEVTKERQLSLKNIPQRYFSEIVWQITKAMANPSGK
ncbi:MAG: DUF4132 domain-containing protein, partial [Acetatifactor sp.]|nr:DUF4132 domain-containing protein [Acetatifactor sp.]